MLNIALQDNLDKFKQMMRTDTTEINKFHNKNINVYTEKVQALENEISQLKKRILSLTLDSGAKLNRTEDIQPPIDNSFPVRALNGGLSIGDKPSEGDKSLQTIVKRLDLVELIADDYLELHVEKEVIKCQQKLISHSYGLEDKIAAYAYILQHYRLISSSLMETSFVKFSEIINSSKNSPQ